MKFITPPRHSLLALLACSIAACSSMNKPSRYKHLQAPADAFSRSTERLQDNVRSYLSDEDRWVPKGRDLALWQSAEMLGVAGRRMKEELSYRDLSSQQLGSLLGNANRHTRDMEYWVANVRVSDSVERSLNEVQSALSVLQQKSRTSARQQGAQTPAASTQSSASRQPAPSRSTRSTTFFSSQEQFSPNDLNGAVTIARNYLEQKYGIKREAIGNMRARELSNHHEVTLETRTTSYILSVDIRKGIVTKEKSAPKTSRRLAGAQS